MRYFYDCEFIEDGATIDLVSIGVVAEDGREFYAVSTEFDPARAGQWVRPTCCRSCRSPADPAWRSRARIRDDLLEFLSPPGRDVELWAWIAAYDHVALCQLWGADAGAAAVASPVHPGAAPVLGGRRAAALPPAPDDAHDALADARHNLVAGRSSSQCRLRGTPV